MSQYSNGAFVYEIEHEAWVKIVGHTRNVPSKLVIPDEIDGLPVYSIEQSAFSWVTEITHLVLPASLKYIEKHAFTCCIQLKEIQFNPGLRYIGGYAFQGCTSLKSLRLPLSMRYVDDEAFSGCELKCLTLPSALRETKTLPGVIKVRYGNRDVV